LFSRIASVVAVGFAITAAVLSKTLTFLTTETTYPNGRAPTIVTEPWITGSSFRDYLIIASPVLIAVAVLVTLQCYFHSGNQRWFQAAFVLTAIATAGAVGVMVTRGILYALPFAGALVLSLVLAEQAHDQKQALEA
jgi:hypothetical protein